MGSSTNTVQSYDVIINALAERRLTVAVLITCKYLPHQQTVAVGQGKPCAAVQWLI
jgi:hypothetical protein